MGIFDRFPYSSTHEMNLDFMLGKATEIAEDMQTVTTGMAQVQAGLSAISEKTEQATQAAAQAAQSASSIEGSVTAAEEAAEEAQMHNESAQTWANNAMTYKADCQRSATEAAASSSSAAQAATAAAASEDTVAQYAQAANASAQSAANNNDSAHQYANQASASASNATFHSSNAQTAATNAQTAATNANTSATNASASADRAASLKTDVETLHRMCTAAVDQAATEAVNAANSAAQAAATKTDVETLVESLPEDFTDLNNTVNQLSEELNAIYKTSKNLITEFQNAVINSDTGAFSVVTSGKRYASTEELIPIDPTIKYTISWNKPTVNPSYAFLFEYTSAKVFIKRVSFSVFQYHDSYEYVPDDSDIAYVRIMLTGDSSTDYDDLIPSEMQFEAGTEITCYTERKAIKPILIDSDEQYKRLVNDKSLRYDFFVPEYYTNSGYMSDKVDAVNTYMDSCYATGDCFAFITDAHWGSYNAQNSPALIRYLYDRTPMSKVFDGGDTGNGGDVNDTIMDYCQAIQASVWNRAYFAVGNHEPFNNVASSYISARFDSRHEKYNGNPDQHYYYIDNERAKIRYIVLACYETGDGNNAFNGIGGNSEASAAQRTWLQNVALNLESGWAAVIIMHSLYYVSNISPYPLVVESRYDSTIAIMDNFVNNGGEICCILQGHTHIDRMTHTPSGIPVFITACDKYVDNETPAGIIVPRPKGTIREQLFDVVCINRDSKIVRLIRIGCPAQNGVDDNAGEETEYRELSWADEGN